MPSPICVYKSTAFCTMHDVPLGLEIGKDIDGGIGDEKRVRMGRHVHDEDVGDVARCAQAH
jgi:hypothetical protein